MSTFKIGAVVEHRTDAALGQGEVLYARAIAGVQQVGVLWSGADAPRQHTATELSIVQSLADRLATVGPASRIPFQLKVLGRWFEARHGMTGELSNQPFQMLPHQVVVTNRVVNSAPTGRAWLIADDVGLGKTIEAGMIMEVLRKKTLGRFRCLIVTPAGLMPQWQDEMGRRFSRRFRVFTSRVANDLEDVDLLLASIDTLKAAKHKRALETVTPWDLVIFDEAHHLATVPSVLAYQLAQHLRDKGKALNLLFLSATPHSGNNEHFFNMLRLLRPDLFPKGRKDYPDVPLKQVMIRNRKSEVTDVDRKKIFRGIGPAKIISFAPTDEEVEFYESLRDYLRVGYQTANKLKKQKDKQGGTAVGFVMSTFAKLASSSRAAIRSAMQNRELVLLGASEGEAVEVEDDTRFDGEIAARRVATLAVGAAKKGSKKRDSLIEGELEFVRALMERLDAMDADGPDSKLGAFLACVKELPTGLKLLIFTEYRATQHVLAQQLEHTFGPGSVVVIHGSMDMAERRKNVEAFNEQVPNPRFMVSTEAGGEGLNMQKSCHTIVNYDLPWNPMALQQRIGRVYRYGQTSPVVVFNLRVDSTNDAYADQRVYEYLERKIDEVTRQLHSVQDGDPEDLRGEVLGQIAEKMSFDALYQTTLEEGRAKAEREIDNKASQIEEILRDKDGMLGLFKGLQRFDITDYEKVAARVDSAHLGFFVEQYLGKQGVDIKRGRDGLLAFSLPRSVVDVGNQLAKSDPYQERALLTEAMIERATVDKKLAQDTRGCRLLRFGDPAFEAMVRHVQHGGFSEGVASLELPAKALRWHPNGVGTWVLFDLQVLRQEGSAGGQRVLRNELAAYLIERGGVAVERDDVVEALHEGLEGPALTPSDIEEAARACAIARQLAEERLSRMYEGVVAEFGERVGILPQPVREVGLAWVRGA
jgi:superfamily II DNA or RNA helicase